MFYIKDIVYYDIVFIAFDFTLFHRNVSLLTCLFIQYNYYLY